jgi:hypothetical protein
MLEGPDLGPPPKPFGIAGARIGIIVPDPRPNKS